MAPTIAHSTEWHRQLVLARESNRTFFAKGIEGKNKVAATNCLRPVRMTEPQEEPRCPSTFPQPLLSAVVLADCAESSVTEKESISWNFEKVVIGRTGDVVARFSPRTKFDNRDVFKVIESELAKEVAS